MKKIYTLLVVLLAIALIAIVCTIGKGGSEPAPQETASPSDVTTPPTVVVSTPSPTAEAAPTTPTPASSPTPVPTPSPSPTPAADSVSITVYIGATTGGFRGVTVTLDELTAQNVASALVSEGVLREGVAADASVSEDKYYGELLDLNLSAAFLNQISGLNERDAYLLLGGIVNTYLAAFGADSIRVTVGGSSIPATVGDYSGYMSEFPRYTPPEPEEITDDQRSTAESITELARSLVGALYEYGKAGPDTFDNSGFVYYCFTECGVTVPRVTSELFGSGRSVSQEELQPGDLVFFTYSDDRAASYVGIYLGEGQFIAENNENSPVKIHDFTSSYFTEKYVGARRYF